MINGKLVELDYHELLDKGQQQQTTTGGWLGITDKYWLVSLIPSQTTSVETRFKGHTLDGVTYYQTETIYPSWKLQQDKAKRLPSIFCRGQKT